MQVFMVSVQHVYNVPQTLLHAVQEYIRQLGGLLVQQGRDPHPTAQQRLQQLTIESSQLIGIIKPLNTAVYKAVLAGRLDEGLTGSQYHSLDEKWYSDLPVGYMVLVLTTSRSLQLLAQSRVRQ